MAAWSGLSGGIKSEIVKRMDMRTRFRFRHVSKSTMTLVDSTPLYIPRIHIKATDFDIRVFVYENTESLIYMSFWEDGFETYFGPPETNQVKENLKISETILTTDAIECLAATLKTLCSPSETTLGALEITSQFSEGALLKLDRHLDGCEIRTKVINIDDDHKCAPILTKCSRSHVEEIHIWKEDGFGELTLLFFESLVSGIRCQIPEDQVKDSQCFYVYTYGLEEMAKELIKNSPLLGLNAYRYDIFGAERKTEHFNTPCGFVSRISAIDLVEETHQKCQKRWTCKDCADPFEYWYYNISPDLLPTREFPDDHYERVIPTVNGVCPVNKFLDEETDKWNLLKAEEFLKILNIIRGVMP